MSEKVRYKRDENKDAINVKQREERKVQMTYTQRHKSEAKNSASWHIAGNVCL